MDTEYLQFLEDASALAKLEGFNDFYKDIASNPYKNFNAQYEAWNDGWHYANEYSQTFTGNYCG